jgi:hypothetical protein
MEFGKHCREKKNTHRIRKVRGSCEKSEKHTGMDVTAREQTQTSERSTLRQTHRGAQGADGVPQLQ